MRKTGLYFGLLLICLACQPTDPLLGTWKITRVAYTPSGLATPEALEQGRQWEQMSSALQNSTFALYENQKSAFFSTRTPFRQGTWATDGDRLTLRLGEGSRPYEFEIFENDGNKLILLLIDSNMTDGELTILCTKTTQYQHDGVDLLSPGQNTWREKPARKETKEEIKARVKAHLDYMITYFEGVEAKNQTFFETGLISSPFVFYSHGLGLSRENRYYERWKESFYDEADASTGFELLRASMRQVKKFPKAATFTKEYLLAFQQMRGYFDQ